MRLLRRRRRLLQTLVVSLACLWIILFFQVHKLDVRGQPIQYSSNGNVITGSIPRLIKKNETISTFPVRQDFQNGIFEGRSSVQDYLASGKDLWEHSTVLPMWMKDYFQWHKTQMRMLELNPDQWDTLNYYLVECTDKYEHCGGTADRLGPLPFHIRIASQNQRLLLIQWTKPAPLEFFLLPPVGSIDWRVPSWLDKKFQAEEAVRAGTFEKQILKFASYPKVRLLKVKLQSHNHASTTYDNFRTSENDPTFAQVYHDLWRIVFTPAPPIVSLIEKQMILLKLNPGSFVSVHLRALYAVEERDKAIVQWWSRNSIHCATSKFPMFHLNPLTATKSRMPILFVSDSTFATKVAESYAKDRGITIVHRAHEKQPLHLEKSSSNNPIDFYDTFVDLYMIGMSRCTAYNMGGFGRWGSLIGYDSNCVFQMTANMIKCNFSAEGRQGGNTAISNFQLPTPLFIPPISTDTATMSERLLGTDVQYQMMTFNATDSLLYTRLDDPNLWKASGSIPEWMKDYFEWHQKTRQALLNKEKWKEAHFLLMECLDSHPSCGGTADRLKPLPSLLRVAAKSKRLLLIHWSRPSKLEEFLVPPKGGIDWRVPDWLHPHLIGYSKESRKGVDPRPLIASGESSVSVRYQSYDAGAGWYNKELKEGEASFIDVYHEVWKIFFTPSPPVAQRIFEFMNHNRLIPGDYASAHVRVLYALSTTPKPRIMRWTKNGLNCASNLRPGKPLFLASDSKFAPQIALEYSIKRNATILTHPNNPDPPLHLDKGEKNLTNPQNSPSDYYDTFVDLYIMALGQCVFISKGGYGHWASLIGGSPSCVYKQKRGKKGIQNPCNWTSTDESSPSLVDIVPIKHDAVKPMFLEPMGVIW